MNTLDKYLYPEIIKKNYKTYTLQVSKIHTITYYTYGNPKGKPVLIIHGGPGGGIDPIYARYCNPKKYYIILVDQRGCGKSTPFGETKENTTWNLIQDFEKIRNILQISKWVLFGGSWGSTLALAYATKHPSVVSTLVLRGIFLCRKKEIQWVQQGVGANYIYPEAWEHYTKVIPKEEQNNMMKAFGKRFRGEFGKKAKEKACLAWSQWEASISHLHTTSHKKILQKIQKGNQYIPMALVEYHYFSHKGFFPRDGFLLEKKNIQKIQNIPLYIVQGQYDMVCPMTSAYELHKKLPKSKMYITLAGHSMLEEENCKKLVEIMKSL